MLGLRNENGKKDFIEYRRRKGREKFGNPLKCDSFTRLTYREEKNRRRRVYRNDNAWYASCAGYVSETERTDRGQKDEWRCRLPTTGSRRVLSKTRKRHRTNVRKPGKGSDRYRSALANRWHAIVGSRNVSKFQKRNGLLKTSPPSVYPSACPLMPLFPGFTVPTSTALTIS